MVQRIMINGKETGYSIERANVLRVLGSDYRLKHIGTEELLKLIYLGLDERQGLSFEDFKQGYATGQVYTLQRKGHYTLGDLRRKMPKKLRKMILK